MRKNICFYAGCVPEKCPEHRIIRKENIMQERPGGEFMSTSYTNGESILVNMRYAENGYLLAYKNGVYGYVDMNYVNL